MPSPKTVSQLGFIVWYLRNEFHQELLGGGLPGKGAHTAENTRVNVDMTQHPSWSLWFSCCFGPVHFGPAFLNLSHHLEQLRLACTPPSHLTQLSLQSECSGPGPS